MVAQPRGRLHQMGVGVVDDPTFAVRHQTPSRCTEYSRPKGQWLSDGASAGSNRLPQPYGPPWATDQARGSASGEAAPENRSAPMHQSVPRRRTDAFRFAPDERQPVPDVAVGDTLRFRRPTSACEGS